MTLSYYDFLWYGKTAWTLFMGLWMPLSYMKVMNIDHARSLFIATSMKSDRYEQWSWLEAMNIDRYDHCSYWFMHECAVHAMKGYWSCMKTVDHSYEQALIMHDNVHIHVIMKIIVTPNPMILSTQYTQLWISSKGSGQVKIGLHYSMFVGICCQFSCMSPGSNQELIRSEKYFGFNGLFCILA